MRIKAHFSNFLSKLKIEDNLKWWNYYDTYKGDLRWDVYTDYILIYGNAACLNMARELKKCNLYIEVEDWRVFK